MTPTLVRLPQGQAIVPGGWTAWVPEVRMEPSDLRAYVASVVDDFHGDVRQAERYVASMIEAEYARCRARNLKLSVAGFARRYTKFAPDLIETRIDNDSAQRDEVGVYVVLGGFNPEEIQGCFLPADNVGRAGKPYADRILKAMAQRERERRRGL